MTDIPNPQGSETDVALRNILEKYPLLGGHDWSIVDSRSRGMQNGGHLEFYSPDEPDSPTPGRPTVEVFDPELRGPELEQAIYGDMLHHLPSVDQKWEQMRQQFGSSLTPQQHAMNQRAYVGSQQRYGEDRPYDEWMDKSRLDAFIRGRLANQWPDDTYTPEQHQILDQMEDHLQQGRRYRTGGLVPRYRAGGFVRKEPTPDYDLKREPWRNDRKSTDELLRQQEPFDPDAPWRPEQNDTPDEPDEPFEYGTPRQPRFPNMYGPRDEEHYAQGGSVTTANDNRISRLMDDPENGSWHDDGKHHVYTPNPSFFHDVDPRHLVDYFYRYHSDDHRLNLP